MWSEIQRLQDFGAGGDYKQYYYPGAGAVGDCYKYQGYGVGRYDCKYRR